MCWNPKILCFLANFHDKLRADSQVGEITVYQQRWSCMRVEQYFKSLTAELEALRDRVRFIIENKHWQTDGEWKESVVRQVLRRHLGASTAVGRGFVVSAAGSSHQLDVLIHDSAKPVLFRDGDLAFVTPDAVVGIIEVKSRATPSIVATAATKLAEDMAIVRDSGNSDAFAGIFSFEVDGGGPEAYLEAVCSAAEHWNNRVDFTCLGCSRFLRYWHLNPEDERRAYEAWQSYALPDTAAGYFVHNIIDAVSPSSVFRNQEVWFPPGGKQIYRDGEILARWVKQPPQAP